MKAENWNKRTKRKEIQFSDEEYIAVEQKASAARHISARLHWTRPCLRH